MIQFIWRGQISELGAAQLVHGSPRRLRFYGITIGALGIGLLLNREWDPTDDL